MGKNSYKPHKHAGVTAGSYKSLACTRFLGFTAIIAIIMLFANFVLQIMDSDVDDGNDLLEKFQAWEKENEDRRQSLRKAAVDNDVNSLESESSDVGTNSDSEENSEETINQKYQGDKVLPWLNPFSTPKKKKGTFLGSDETEEEELERILNEQIADWLAEEERTSELEDLEKLLEAQKPILERLRKRQKFIEKQFAKEVQLSIGPASDYEYKVSKLVAAIPENLRVEIMKQAGMSFKEFKKELVQNAKYAVISSKGTNTDLSNQAIMHHLSKEGYKPKISSETDKTLPLVLLAYGQRCVSQSVISSKDSNEHVIYCVSPALPMGTFYPAMYPPENDVTGDTTFNSELDEFWSDGSYLQSVFRLYVQGENEYVANEVNAAAWVIVPKYGSGAKQLITNIASAAEKYRSQEQGCIVYPFENSPLLWNRRKFYIRSWIILAKIYPLKLYYGGSYALRSNVEFLPFGTQNSIKLSQDEKIAMYFPNAAPNPEILSLEKLVSAFPGAKLDILSEKLKAASTFAAAGLFSGAKYELTRYIAISHLCLDFLIQEIEPISLKVESIGTDCRFGTNTAIETGILAAEVELHGFLNSKSVPGLTPLIDETRRYYVRNI